MDGQVTPDVSSASTETVSTPSETTLSASVQPEAPASLGQQAAESVPAAPPELPDEQAFELLSGPERGNNWKQARARIAELNGQVQQYSPYQSAIQAIEERGGWDTVQQAADLGALLFSQVENPETGQITLSAEPLIERLASESPYTLDELVWKGIHQPDPYNPNQTIAHAFVRDYLGLDPSLLDIYRQIQSPADAQKYLQPGQVTAEELQGIPQEFHEAYRSLTPRQREEINLANEEARNDFLQDKADALKARQFIAQQEQDRQQQQQYAQQQFEQRVEQRGTELGQAMQNVVVGNARTKLQTEASLSADTEVNDTIHGECIQWAAQQVLADPSLAQDNDRADKLYKLSAERELRGDKFQAAQYKAQADNLAKKLEGRFLNYVTKRTAFWSKALGSARQAQQQQVEQARPRAEIAANNAPLRQNQGTQTVGQGFQPTPQRMAQYEQMLRAAEMRNG